jgi:hypothetical protein
LHTIARYEFLSGCAFILGSPVPRLGNAKKMRNNTVNNDDEKEQQRLPQNSRIITQLLPLPL